MPFIVSHSVTMNKTWGNYLKRSLFIYHSMNVGLVWVANFLKGHRKLSLWTTEATHIAIALSFNKTNIDVFSDNLKEVPQSAGWVG